MFVTDIAISTALTAYYTRQRASGMIGDSLDVFL
jgi:hypothetical protein